MRAPTRMPPRALRAPGASRREPGGADSHTAHCFARPHLAGASATRCGGRAERSDGPKGSLAVRMFCCPTPAGCACGGGGGGGGGGARGRGLRIFLSALGQGGGGGAARRSRPPGLVTCLAGVVGAALRGTKGIPAAPPAPAPTQVCPVAKR